MGSGPTRTGATSVGLVDTTSQMTAAPPTYMASAPSALEVRVQPFLSTAWSCRA